MPEITQEYLQELLSYDAETGEFTWKHRRFDLFKTEQAAKIWNARFPGTSAGSLDIQGYYKILIHGVSHRSHRLAWLFVYGAWPDGQIDHINGVRNDNRIVNLRVVSNQENARNRRITSISTTGEVGVVWSKRSKKWLAQIFIRDKQKRLGLFEKFEDAVKARKEAVKAYGFHENHGRTTVISGEKNA